MNNEINNLYTDLLGGTNTWRIFIPFEPLPKYIGFIQEPYTRIYVLDKASKLTNLFKDELKLFELDSYFENNDGIYLQYRLSDSQKEYSLTWKNQSQDNEENVVAREVYEFATELFTMLKRNVEYHEFQPVVLMSQTNVDNTNGKDKLDNFNK